MNDDDAELLRQYVDERSNEAFSRLVERHVDLVHSAALRQVGGDPHLAEDVTQHVFVVLARKADRLRRERILAAWLLNVTRYAALDAIKKLARRRRHERRAAELAAREADAVQRASAMRHTTDDSFLPRAGHQSGGDPSELWDDVKPALDAAIGSLSGSDRRAIVMRYFEQRSLDEIAALLGVSKPAAKQRVHRALGRLRGRLARRGVAVTSAAALALSLTSHSVQAAPAGLAASASAHALHVAAAAAATGSGFPAILKGGLKLMAWTKAKTAGAALVATLLLGGTALVIVNLPPGNRGEIVRPLAAAAAAAPSQAPAAGTRPSGQQQQAFDELYKLDEGQTLKFIPQPFVAGRMPHFQNMFGRMGPLIKPDQTQLVFDYDGAKLKWRSGDINPGRLENVLIFLGFRPDEIVLGPGVEKGIPVDGDLVLRNGASREAQLVELEHALATQVNRPLHFEKRHEDRDVITLRGHYSFNPLPDYPKAADRAVELFIADPSAEPPMHIMSGTSEMFAGTLQLMLGTRVIDETHSKPTIRWRDHGVMARTPLSQDQLRQFLDNISRQSSLDVSLARQPMDVWYVLPGPAPTP